MKILNSICVLSALVFCGTRAAEEVTESAHCDRILSALGDTCLSISSSLSSSPLSAVQLQQACCGKWRYDICVQSVLVYSRLAKTTSICPEQVYSGKVDKLNADAKISAITKRCELARFNYQTCLTTPVANAWNQVSTQVQNNVDVNQIAGQIGQNWNQAVSSVSSFAQNLQHTIAQQNITDRLRQGLDVLQTNLREGTKQLSDSVSGQAANRYMVEGEQQDSTLQNIVQSVVPQLEIVPVQANDAQPKSQIEMSTPVPAIPSPTANRRFSLMQWFNSAFNQANPQEQAKEKSTL